MARRTAQTVTPAEWRVLEALWDQAPLSAREIHERLPLSGRGQLQTTRTLVERLLAKGAVERRNAHGIWVFGPKVQRDEAVCGESRRFLDRFFNGRPVLGALHFLESEPLSEEELLRLCTLIENRLKGARDDA